MDVTHNSQIPVVVDPDRMEGPLGKPVFKDKSEAEVRAINDLGKTIEIEAAYNGSNFLHVPRWSVRKWFDCIDHVAGIIAQLFPNDIIFLVSVNYNDTATAAVQVADIFKRAYDEIMQVVCLTLDITEDEEIKRFINSLTWLDAFEIFATIIEQEINSHTAEAVLKKVQRLLIERFRMESGSFDFNAILGLAMSMPSSTDTPSTNS